MSSREDPAEPGASGTSPGQAAPDESRESGACPECRQTGTGCSGSCRHCFCRLCLWDWSLGPAVCPRCRRPTRHPYPRHVPLYHEVQDRVYRSKSRRQRSAGWPRSCGRDRERGRPWHRRRRSVRWPRDGRWQSRHGRGSDSPRWRWREQQRRAWEDAPEEGWTPRMEWAIPASSQGNRSRRQSHRSWRRRERSRGRRGWSRSGSRSRSRSRERSQSWDRRQSRSSRREQDTQPGSPGRSAGQRHWRSWNADGRHTPSPQHHGPSERSETQAGEDTSSSRQWRTRRRQSRGRSHRRWQNSQGTEPHDLSANQRRWNADGRLSPRPQHDSASRRSERHQWQEHARSQSRGRSHRRGQNSHTASQGMLPPDHSTRQREQRSWSGDQEQAPRFQQDIPGSSGRSHAGRRDS